MAIETVELTTLDGVRLAGDLAVHPGATVAAVVCHPHPLYGGDRQSPVVDAVFRALDAAGVMTVRFDFRGAGDSDGEHGGGADERLDVAAAIELLAMCTDAPVWLVGYSFGAAVALDVVHPRTHGWVAIAPPLAMMPGARLAADDHRPTHVVLAGHDQFGPAADVMPVVEQWRNTTVRVLPSADHFLAGHLAAVAADVVDHVTG
jgi:alpha/beta superfamily hydrolase